MQILLARIYIHANTKTLAIEDGLMPITQKTLLSLKHEDLKSAIISLLRDRKNSGGRGSIKRSVLQKELTRFLELAAVLGNARDSGEANLNKAISALRRETNPKLDRDRADDLVRLAK